jgi:hypothetical protein
VCGHPNFPLGMIVGVFAVGFDQEMVAIGDRGIAAYLLYAHSLKQKSAQWTGSIVHQKLIDL